MATRIVAHHIEPPRPPSLEDLRQVFEKAVGEIHHADRTVGKLQYRAPIVPRAKILGLSKEGAEKLALSDAARALAQLWNV